MNTSFSQPLPKAYSQIEEATKASGFTMASDLLTGSLLGTLAASKPGGKFLEMGTGTGLSTSWLLNGMDRDATLISVDYDPKYIAIAEKFLGDDKRLSLVTADGGEWIDANSRLRFDFIFADTWHGKYLMLDETLAMLNKGGFYIIDDMLRQPNWPEGHHEKVTKLIASLEALQDLFLTKQVWSTGIIIAVKK
ncbi:Predicted O-methyltransferase YrrM [Chryseolinea serpens]|uniref:Predicted O-methyltransferase YrrM n=1 Tax=Chryseolinea serpens TaxID=947013 RepID=A0A1M5NB30_9BACT|nr:class I SAM-dependent methyltransferase [Chryseolinea serpens]SHG86764.1 Predicted O-methyltransferase YrrM [Chryseolinea serpens]